ncbi:hypothetical protein BOTCAL_0076g00180 [Botryotinia calthae]|uniref:Uncharacterized protein n=1 Tax=Botryotinia calthae TaxID=38488 RepID=A0A4Y8DAS3_9HELO|nr:hypothetical protein BOTCAL_0076g00180 [Botryotinia calthae]
MSRQSSANHNSRPISISQTVNQQLPTSYSQESKNESVTGTSDSHRSSNGCGRVRESRNTSGKYLSARGRQERRDNKEFANSSQERERSSAENRRKVLERRHRDEETRRRERLEKILEEKDKVREEKRVQEIERTGGWYQNDLEHKEKRRQQKEISRRIVALPPRQRLQEERIQKDKSRKEKIAQELYRLKREDDIKEGKRLSESYRCREGERLGEESQLLRLDNAWKRGFDVRRVDVRKWVLGLTYRPDDHPVVPFYSRVGARPSMPLPRQSSFVPQLHRSAPPPPPPPPRRHQPHQNSPPPPCHPALSRPYNSNPPPRIKSECIPPPPPPPRRTIY